MARKPLTIAVNDEDEERIDAEQRRLSVPGLKVSKSAAARSLIAKGSNATKEEPNE